MAEIIERPQDEDRMHRLEVEVLQLRRDLEAFRSQVARSHQEAAHGHGYCHQFDGGRRVSRSI